MIIKILNYRLVSDTNGTYDLIQEQKGQKKDGKSYVRKVTIAYSITLERAINKIISTNLHENPIELELNQFLTEYRNERKQIERLLDLEILKI